MSPEPLADGLHRHRLSRHLSLVDQEAADRAVRPAIGAGVADAALTAVGESQRPASLDLHEKDVDRVAGPGELQAAAREAARVDLGSPPVRYQLSSLHSAEQPLASIAGIEHLETHLDQVIGQAENRNPVFRAWDFG